MNLFFLFFCLFIFEFNVLKALKPLVNGTCNNVCDLEVSNLSVYSVIFRHLTIVNLMKKAFQFTGVWYRYAAISFPWQKDQSCSYANITAESELSALVHVFQYQ
jgi:hypothetical protein